VNGLDFILIVLLTAVAIRGVASGFLRQAGSLSGFVLGLVIGALVAPWVGNHITTTGTRVLVVLAVFFGIAVLIGGLGEAIGFQLSRLAERHRLALPDSFLGAIFGILVTLAAVWLLAPTFSRAPSPVLADEIQGSFILQTLDRSLPPVPDVMARLERSLGIASLPRAFAGLEPAPPAPVTGPNAAAVNAAAAAGQTATVKIEGLGCGGVLEGTGIVVAQNLVATNAHVVAGIVAPSVIDANGRHDATVVFFDPNLDFAVLRVSGLAAPPLNLASTTSPRGTVGAVLGYPGGGAFTVQAAAVLDSQTAIGRNIYDAGLVRRQIYELQAIVRPGNSGGPLITPGGTVIGIVFAMSTTNSDIGYALTSAEVLPDIRTAASSGPVSDGPCVSD
jgi:S1-C subfamily serine protease